MHLDVCFFVGTLCAGRFGLGWAHDDIFVARHMIMHYSCIRTFSFLVIGIFCDWHFSICFSLSLPLSWIVYAWHLSANLLRPGTLFVPRHHLLILFLFLSSFVMRRPIRTSRRTSPNVAFIRNAVWFYRIIPILLYPLSFIVEDGNLYVRYPWAVPPWSYRSSTPICMVSIPLYLGLLYRFEVYVS